MRTARDVFVNSAIFGVVVGIVYWFVSHHLGGTILLTLMGAGTAFAAGMTYAAERNAQLLADRDEARPGDGAGTEIAIVTASSIWPPLAALAAFGLICGVMFAPIVAVAASALLLIVLWRLVLESDRR